MKAEYINSFIKATIRVLHTMAEVRTRAKKPYLKKDDLATGDVSTIVGLTCQSTGTFSISFAEACILRIASNIFGEELKELDRESIEVAGEIANMISGQARQEIERLGLLLDGAIPSIFFGKGHTIYHMTEGPKIAIPFIMEEGVFTMEVCFDF